MKWWICLGLCVCSMWAKPKPQWVESKICEQEHCAIGQASKQEGETSAIARALKELRLSLNTSVQAEYEQSTDESGQSVANERIRIYAGAHNIGYKILDRYEDSKYLYIKLQYDPSKKLVKEAPAPEFRELDNLEKLCQDSKLDGYYCVHLGNAYHKGELELAKNDKLALKYYKKACLMGTLEGCVLAGEIALKESKKSAQWYFSHACENGYGLACAKSAGLEELVRKRLDLYALGCKLNDSTSCAYLGEIYALGLANLQANHAKAKDFYKQSARLDPYGDGAVLLLGESNFDPASMQRLCDHNNARACALLGQQKQDSSLLQKAFSLGSAQAAYFLALQARDKARDNFLTHSCEIGVRNDFTKACEALGDTLLASDKARAQDYYATSCNHLFYEASACQKLYDLSPDKCENESVCVSLAIEQDPALALSSAVDSIIDDDSPLDPTLTPKPSQNKSLESTFEKVDSTPKSTAKALPPSKPKIIKLFGELGLGGVGAMRFPEIKGMHKILDDEAMSFAGSARLGIELSTAKQPLSFYAAPFIELAWQGLFSAEDFAREKERDDDKSDEESGRVSALLFGSGIQAGVQYKIYRAYGIVNYLANFSKLSHDISVPLRDMLGVGFGVGIELSSMRLGVQYLYQSYTYHTGYIYSDRHSSILVLDSTSKARSGAHGVFLTIGFGF